MIWPGVPGAFFRDTGVFVFLPLAIAAGLSPGRMNCGGFLLTVLVGGGVCIDAAERFVELGMLSALGIFWAVIYCCADPGVSARDKALGVFVASGAFLPEFRTEPNSVFFPRGRLLEVVPPPAEAEVWKVLSLALNISGLDS